MKDKAKNGLRTGLIIFVLAVLIGYLLISGFMDLSGKNTVGVEVVAGDECFDVEHSAMGIIPIGKEHYFLGYEPNNDAVNFYCIRAKKNWMEKNFNEDGMVEDEPLTVIGLKKRLDVDIERKYNQMMTEVEATWEKEGIEKIEYPVGEFYYIDVNYKFAAVMKITAGFMFLIAACLAIVRKLFGVEKGALTFVPAILVIAGLAIAVFGVF